MKPVNYYQYRLNITKWNDFKDENLVWDLSYDFLKEYNLPDMSINSWESLTERLRSDEKTLEKYIFNTDSGVKNKHALEKDISRNSYYCKTFNVNSQARKCRNPDAKDNWQDWFMKLLRGPWKERIN